MATIVALIAAGLTVCRDEPLMGIGVSVAAVCFAVGFAKRARVKVTLRRERRQVAAEQRAAAAIRHEDWEGQRQRLQRARELRLTAKRMSDSEVA